MKKYGQKAKIFYCKKDKIYFYYNDSEYPYEGLCPVCNRYICYFCLEINWYENCCLIKKVYHILYEYAMTFIDPNSVQYYKDFEFNDYLLYAIIPYLNSLFFFGGLHVYI